ncbi:ankyrin repeat domain-containing protein [Phenylobacterium sp. LjRoot225]|uniref:hypothetical protein n=1 Tax=Phenylobacterium sp. LjRoot225 TaxID=3342285 RepID=UPI003ED04102
MSDHDAAPDPIDKAYVQAETLLGDEEARVARRARVLAAVTRQPEAAPAAAPPTWRSVWRRGGVAAAAIVGGLSVLLAMHLRQPAPVQLEPAPAPEEAAHGVTPKSAAPPIAAAPPTTPSPAALAPRTGPATRDQSEPGGSDAVIRADRRSTPAFGVAPRAPIASHNVPTIPPLPVPPVAHPIEEPAAPQPPPQDAGASRALAPSAVAPRAFPAAEPDTNDSSLAEKSTGGSPADQAARLRGAAAAGRIGEVKALLAQGIPVDAADADGETALMKSIRVGQPAVAALLRARGASLDRENRAGESARDMAAAKGDARLNEALGLPH